MEEIDNEKKGNLNCNSIAVEIDYSYLRAGIWMDKEECIIHKQNDADRLDRSNKFWSLMNCERK